MRISRSAARPAGVSRCPARAARTQPKTIPPTSAGNTLKANGTCELDSSAIATNVRGSESTTHTVHTTTWITAQRRHFAPEPGAASSPRAASASPVSWTAGSTMAAYRTW